MEHKKAFNWAKAQLAECGTDITSIADLTKGDILAKLLGWIAKRKVDKIIGNPKLRIEHVQNINVALSFAKNELHMKHLSLNAEGIPFQCVASAYAFQAFMDPSTATASKAAWSLLTMLYKQYGTPPDDATEFPLIEWARSLSERDIPSLKSMSDGRAFLSIISKLSVHEPATLNDSGQLTSEATPEAPVVRETEDPPSDPVELALFLTKQHFGIEPPMPASDISSGNVSSILSFLTLLHNVAVMRSTKTQFEEDNIKNNMMIQSLKIDNTRLEHENTQTVQELQLLNERVITKVLEEQRAVLSEEVAALKDGIAVEARRNEVLKETKRNKEREWTERTLQCRLKFESHVNHLREYLQAVGDAAALFDIQDNLTTVRHSLVGSEQTQIDELYHLINAENEKIQILEERLRLKAQEETAAEERKRMTSQEVESLRASM